MNTQPYNVCLSGPKRVTNDWQQEAEQWAALNRGVGGNSEFNPLTIKTLYVTGIILNACKSVSSLLDFNQLISTTFYSGYIVFSTAVELLGRCVNGARAKERSTNNLISGFKWITMPQYSQYQSIGRNQKVVTTRLFSYSIDELVALRNFSAHGQAVKTNDIKDFDYFILGEMPLLMGNAVENYLSELKSSTDLAEQLARAEIFPYRNRPIFDSLWAFNAEINSFPKSIGNAFRSMDWTYKSDWRF